MGRRGNLLQVFGKSGRLPQGFALRNDRVVRLAGGYGNLPLRFLTNCPTNWNWYARTKPGVVRRRNDYRYLSCEIVRGDLPQNWNLQTDNICLYLQKSTVSGTRQCFFIVFAGCQPLMPLTAIPSTNCFWSTRYRINGGRNTTVQAAMALP